MKLRFFAFIILFFINQAIAQAGEKNLCGCVNEWAYDSWGKNPPSGLFISSDGGKSWIHKGWKNIKANSIAIEPGSNGRVILSCATETEF